MDAGRWLKYKIMKSNEYEKLGELFYGWVIEKIPDMERRGDSLLAVTLGLGIEGVIAEANREPVEVLIPSCGRAMNAGKSRILSIDHVSQIASVVKEDQIIAQKVLECVNPLLGAPRPQDDLLVSAVEHHHVASESGDLPTQIGERHMLSAGDEAVNCGLHSLDNAR